MRYMVVPAEGRREVKITLDVLVVWFTHTWEGDDQ
jgi:hypothetical protein